MALLISAPASDNSHRLTLLSLLRLDEGILTKQGRDHLQPPILRGGVQCGVAVEINLVDRLLGLLLDQLLEFSEINSSVSMV